MYAINNSWNVISGDITIGNLSYNYSFVKNNLWSKKPVILSVGVYIFNIYTSNNILEILEQ